MRTTLLPSMLNVVATNLKRKSGPLRLFEVSRVYLPKKLPLEGTLPMERKILIMAMTENAGGFHALKGDVENVLELLGVYGADFCAGGEEYMHPGR